MWCKLPLAMKIDFFCTCKKHVGGNGINFAWRNFKLAVINLHSTGHREITIVAAAFAAYAHGKKLQGRICRIWFPLRCKYISAHFKEPEWSRLL